MRLLFAMALVFPLVLGISSDSRGGGGMESSRSAEATAPRFAAKDLDGNPVEWESLRKSSSAVVLNFWGVRCSTCIEEMPYLAEISRKMSPRGIRVVGVNVDGIDGVQLKETLRKIGLSVPYPLIVDSGFAIMDLYKVDAVPATFVILPDETVIYRHFGFEEGDEKLLEEKIMAILGNGTGGK